jgi:N-acetylmuramoyl-L-alanine amidase
MKLNSYAGLLRRDRKFIKLEFVNIFKKMRFSSERPALLSGCFVFLFIFGLFFGETVFGASSASVLYEKARTSYHSLLKSESNMQRRDRWMAVIQKFEVLQRRYSGSHEGYKASFTIGDLYQRLYAISQRGKDLDRALEYYRKTIEDFKPGRLTDDALLKQGEIYLEQRKYASALESFKVIRQKFSDGDMIAQAQKRISEVRPLVPVRSAESEQAPRTSGATLKKIEYTVGLDSVRVVVHANRPISFSQGRLPDRVYLDFEQTQLAADVKRKFKVESRFLKGIRLSQFGPDTSRLVFDLSVVNNLKVGAWQEESRLIVELSREKTHRTKVVSKPVVPIVRKKVKSVRRVPPKAVAKKSVPTSEAALCRASNCLIVVDAGHGGKDLGAKGHGGLLEKDVNLAIALRLRDILKSRYKYSVVLSRGDDTFLSLEKRGAIANKKNADVFVSVHANAAERRGAYGVETYYLGDGKSEQAQETAARENREYLARESEDLEDEAERKETQLILADLMGARKMQDSGALAGTVQKRLVQSMSKKYSKIKNLGAKQGSFFVLHAPSMPSILVEVGFVTNPREERRLKQSAYLDSLAVSIAQGIAEYIRDERPI